MSVKRSEKWSILPAYTIDGFVAWDVIQGSYNKELFNDFIRNTGNRGVAYWLLRRHRHHMRSASARIVPRYTYGAQRYEPLIFDFLTKWMSTQE